MPPRKGSPKVKTGCRTCKARKVKCDEAKPKCMRCTSSGRECAGYEPNFEHGLAWYRPQQLTAHDQREGRAFQFFSHMVGPVLSGPTDSYFWTHLVVQFSHFEPAVRHAVLAISSLYEDFHGGARVTRQKRGNAFALSHYSAAIEKIKGAQDEQLVLLVCVLFVCVEYLQGDVEAALRHCKHGILILNKIGCSSWAREYLMPIFRRLSFISFFLGKKPSDDVLVPGLIGYEASMPPRFTSVEEAQNAIDDLTVHAIELVAKSDLSGREPLETRLQEFHAKVSELDATIPPQESVKKIAICGMKIKTEMARIQVNTIDGEGESRFDEWSENFRTIVALARRAAELKATFPDDRPRASFTFEQGFLSMMGFVSVKCRDLQTRLEALELMTKIPAPKEGLLDVGTLYRVGRRGAEIEHGVSLDDGTLEKNPAAMAQVSFPPESKRLLGAPIEHELDVIKNENGTTTYRRTETFYQGIFDMVSLIWAMAGAVAPAIVRAATLSDVCTTTHAQEALPAAGTIPGITIDASSVQTAIISNTSVTSEWYPTSTIDYCNVTFAYSHDGLPNDIVHVTYWVPAPDAFQNRYVSTGGGGLAINSQSQYIPTGIIVGAVSGITDGGFGSFNTQWDAVFLAANGTTNWQSVYMFGYQAHNELAILGKQFTRNFYGVAADQKIYSYYQGCSEGGREGWSQVQRFGDQFDGAVTGAPAFRYGQQQVNHLTPNVMETTRGYFPPSCELDKILNLTIAACDPLDGKTDGVVSRSDLCKLTFDFNSTVGEAYSCEASSGSSGPGGFGGLARRQFPGSSPTPAQNGTVTAEGAALVAAYYDGLHDSEGKRVYLNYQPGSAFTDASTKFDESTGTWGVSISGLGGEWVARYLQLRDTSTLESLNSVTYDTLRDWMLYGMNHYADSLQTTNPDLSAFQAAGGKVLHVHGEQDDSIPAASSVHYYESVRSVMFPGQGFNESSAALDEFYRLYLVPGGAHCGVNSHQPNGGWPQTTLQTVIDWVENGAAPDTLNSTGDISTLCRWPLRPLWTDNGAKFDCVYDQASIDTWKYTFDAFKVPVY
nr:tannase subunit protein [Colletotrichum truncatum]KAF6789531.1 tannase subunit protein [Colletotrichum truncatum]